jgi:hypothetical protein
MWESKTDTLLPRKREGIREINRHTRETAKYEVGVYCCKAHPSLVPQGDEGRTDGCYFTPANPAVGSPQVPNLGNGTRGCACPLAGGGRGAGRKIRPVGMCMYIHASVGATFLYPAAVPTI